MVKLQYIDEVFNYFDSGEEDMKFNSLEIRDAFYEFFIQMFKNFEKYFGKFKKKKDGSLEPLNMNKDVFLKDHS